MDGFPLIRGLRRPVTTREIEDFDRDGVVCLRGILEPDWLEGLSRTVDIALNREEENSNLGATEKPPIRQKSFLSFAYPEVKQFSYYCALPEIAGQLLQTKKVNLYSDSYLVKPPRCTEETPWHQDFPYYPLTGTQMLATWVALDEVSATTGRVEYVAGSHRWGLLFRPLVFVGEVDDRYDEANLESVPDIDASRDDYEILAWDLVVGDIVVHNARTVHYARGNSSSTTSRRAFITRFLGDDIRWRPTYHDYMRPGNGQYPMEPGLAVDGPVTCELFPVVWERSLREGAKALPLEPANVPS